MPGYTLRSRPEPNRCGSAQTSFPHAVVIFSFHGVQRATGDVVFLVDAAGSDALHHALRAAGARCLHRRADAANYATGSSRLAPVDFIIARRPSAREMLGRTKSRLLRAARLRVPVVDAEALIGLREQSRLRPPRSERDLDEFLEFLGRLQVLFRPADRPRPLTRGEHFRL